MVPSLLPTGSPTFTQTLVPSAAPTVRPVKFTSNITMDGVTTPTLTVPAQKSITNATATSMGISESSVSFLGSSVASSSGRRSLKGISVLATTYTVIATTQTALDLAASGYGSAEELFNALSQMLADAVDSGKYSTVLHRNAAIFGAPEVASANGTQVTSSLPVQEDTESDSKKKEVLSTGGIIGVVIGGVVFLILCFVVIFYCCCRAGSEAVRPR